MIGIPLGLLAANATEWVVHKHMLHGLGLNKKSFWAFHWHVHHRIARKSQHDDPDYTRPWWSESPRRREVASLVGVAAAVAPLFPVAPFFTMTAWYATANYYVKHKKSHLDREWARTHLSWHYDHHMGPDQNCNWGVTRPWFDQLLGTRVPYVGTEREALDQQKMAKFRARKAAKAA
jgi:sterol desaturase/sphingolipid hydroxylase (fatty acid hydroxylase superfamily)